RCPRRTEFVSRREFRYLLRQARFGHNLANALDEGCGAERLLPQDHLNSGIQPRMILDRKVARSDDNDRDLVPDGMLLHLCYELKSVHLWHHQIENDDVRNASPSRSRATRPFSASISNHVWGPSQDRMRSRCIASSSTTKTRVGPEGALCFAIRS